METSLTSGQLAQQLLLFSQKGMTPERWNSILSSGFLADLCDPNARFENREAFRTVLGLPPKVSVSGLELSVDYARPFGEMVAGGKYDIIHPALEDPTLRDIHFSIQGRGSPSWRAKLIFSDGLTPAVMTGAMHSSGWLPAKIEHLLAFGERYPNEQYKYDVLAPGSTATVQGDVHMPGLTCRGRERELTLFRNNQSYGRGSRFLKVRPQTA